MGITNFDKYHFYFGDNGLIVAVSTYAGRTVKGYARCHPGDIYDKEFGMRLAAVRCGLKIAQKRRDRALKKHLEAINEYTKAKINHELTREYLSDATAKTILAREELEAVLDELN